MRVSVLVAIMAAALSVIGCDNYPVIPANTCTQDSECPHTSVCIVDTCVLEMPLTCEDLGCPADSLCINRVCTKQLNFDCNQLGCPEGSNCIADTGVCYENPFICSAQIGGPMGTITPVLQPATEVELINVGLFRVPGNGPCMPEVFRLTFRVTSPSTFVPEIKMTINGQDTTLIADGGGVNTDQWHYRSYKWEGSPIHPMTNSGGDRVRLHCTNCNQSMPAGVLVIASLTGWWWKNDPTDSVKFEYHSNFEHYSIFP